MAYFYPSFETLELADQILIEIGNRVEGYQGRIGTKWYWRLPGGVLVTIWLDYTKTEQRWDMLRAEATTPKVGSFNSADFPMATYGTLLTSPPFIHELEGEAEWSNRLYFQMGYLIEDVVLWMEMLRAAVLDPNVRPPATIPDISILERELVSYVVQDLDGYFRIKDLHDHFKDRVSRQRISTLAQKWEALGLLTKQPRRVTIALRSLVELEEE
ncbi:MAG: hypothetical protein JW981_02780 [Anaerolineae bacterium]|nr:hypothetical protein [Anaerolineae bacterium]